MTEQKHTPGPLTYNNKDGQIQSHDGKRLAKTLWLLTDSCDANGELLAATYNAFDSAAKRLSLNAIDLAEQMEDGGIADLVAALLIALPFVEDVLDSPEQLKCFKKGAVQKDVKKIRAALARAGVT